MMRASVRRLLALVLAYAGGTATGTYLAGGATLAYSVASPDGRERLDVYHANRWQALRRPGAEMLGYARLVRLAGGETLGTSSAFEVDGAGGTSWADDAVQIGSSARFDRSTSSWSVDR